MEGHGRVSVEDPFRQFKRLNRKLHSLWLTWTYPFVSVGRKFSADSTCDIKRATASYIRIGNNVLVGRNTRVDVVVVPKHRDPVILIDDGCSVGDGVIILALNRIHIERNNLFGPCVFLTDHNHAFRDVTLPIMLQGTTQGGTVRIEEGCWFGFGAAVISSRGELVIGRNSVIGANAVVTRSIPPYSVVTGNPARVVKKFDPEIGNWVKVTEEPVQNMR